LTSPIAALSAETIDFGSVATGGPSPARTITLTNAGAGPLAVASIAISGAHAADFAQTNTCTAPLAPAASCSIAATFTPLAVGTRFAMMSVFDNAPGAPHHVALTGTGTGFSIVPRTAVLTPTVSQQFTVLDAHGSVVWAVDGIEGGTPSSGTITPAGLYSPPASAGMHSVTVSTSG